ncbi:hypothetical protein T02_7469 [Trichinella nativa]|uniref:Uncharacterized protein n=1 Tax=Trichinella nativa TaxID=6335 RepID=A0A0V1L289_9BILA|nr:hypothetical protein T06_13645 [Trichinella sp. T6]KRZ53674.1 hypothetical protein T02_7469 [Trichinella nativa]
MVPSRTTIRSRCAQRLLSNRLPSGAARGQVLCVLHSRICWSSLSLSCHCLIGLAASSLTAPTGTSAVLPSSPHCLQTRRDSASAFWCFRPARWTTSKSNSANLSSQRATCPSGSRKFRSHLKELWSVRAMNLLPYRYGRKC